MENYGVDPDIEVTIDPAPWHSETDPHLDTAIGELFRRLEIAPAARPPQSPEPRVRPAS